MNFTNEPFLSQIMIVSFPFPPKGWALCNGQFLPINQNQALFSLLGTTYGGNGQTNFALPNFRGKAPLHMGNGFILGQQPGSSFHTLTQPELPQHLHQPATGPQMYAQAGGPANTGDPAGNYLGSNPAHPERFRTNYDDQMGSTLPLQSEAVGGSQPHENRMPFLVLNYIIALQGIFPSQN